MNTRINLARTAPKVVDAVLALQAHVDGSGLEPALMELVKMRASQINGCAFCLDMHSKDARAAGESEQRLYLLDAWREAPLYSARECAALEWTEAVTRLGDRHVPDDVYARAREQFSEEQLANLTLAVVAINGWNRLNIAFRPEVGRYQPGMFKRKKSA